MNKVYVAVRKDLKSKSYQAVQGGHAVAQLLIDDPLMAHYWKNGYLIYVEAENEEHLKYIYGLCLEYGSPVSLFRESDLNDEATAIACYTIDGDPIFRRLPLM